MSEENRLALDESQMEPVPTEQPQEPNGRFLLNAYGRRCYELGIEQGKKEQLERDKQILKKMQGEANANRLTALANRDDIDAHYCAYRLGAFADAWVSLSNAE